MTATYVLDDHLDLSNVGQTTHVELDTHVSSSQFLVLSSSANIPPQSRKLQLGRGLIASDAGPKGNFTISIDPSYLPNIFKSHWNTADGTNYNQLVTESLTRTTTRISTPNGGEGTPFYAGGWATTNQPTHRTSPVTFVTPGAVTGFGSGSFFDIAIIGPQGKIQGYRTGALTGSGVLTSGAITLTLTNFTSDFTRYAATASISVNIASALPNGGRYYVTASHFTDPTTDDGTFYNYTQSDVFYDTNPTSPSIDGTVTIAETSGSVTTKHISGIEYYTIPSAFTLSVTGINKLNENTISTSNNITLTGTEYGLTTANHSPFGTGASYFSGWTNDNNNISASYVRTDWTVATANYRYIGSTANVSAQVRDPWTTVTARNTANASVLIDTYGTTSTNTLEDFDDEARRQTNSYNSGSTTGNWNSSNTLVAGELLCFGGQLMIPSTSTMIRSDGASTANANWSTYLPNASGSNPNYSSLTSSGSYYRTFVDAAGTDRASFTVVFTGTFVSGSATSDLSAGAIRMFIRKRAGIGNTGYTTPYPLKLHGAVYNFSTFDDGVTDGQCRDLTSSGNTVNGTFGGFAMRDGVFVEIVITNTNTKIGSVSWTFI